MNCMEKNFWNANMKGDTTADKMLAGELILVLKTQWKVSDAMGMNQNKEMSEYRGFGRSPLFLSYN
ncbi:hypothetical protein [Brevibacillus laterosporus]|uniref:hypothetical protein n=1 Tax=Brevibacillus laterosporus TaxID=1465 RepID=UPI000E6D4123|nr:hypothetical protein [Brevibacillus laterosporus]AYB37865.1 hypothetical protein D5F52_05995 [Brevibacillus laterosporus]MBM7109473.1 hypothetical protein [Brevibacillus laterosporus]NKQ18832.1 hypothetical protein [Brevibacillus laterosporus]WNX29390.1 hypothetical protein RWW94_14195 [Brevibacillus laterosporus]